jgi:hypothetical protein
MSIADPGRVILRPAAIRTGYGPPARSSSARWAVAGVCLLLMFLVSHVFPTEAAERPFS